MKTSLSSGYRMSKALREELEFIAVLCSDMDPHSAAERLERLLGGCVDDDLQRVIYPGEQDETQC